MTNSLPLSCTGTGETPTVYTAVSRKVVAKTVHATIPKSNMGYDQCTFSWHCSCRSYFCCFALISPRKRTSMDSRAILSNLFEKQSTKNHPQYLSGLSRALFPTTFLEGTPLSETPRIGHYRLPSQSRKPKSSWIDWIIYKGASAS